MRFDGIACRAAVLHQVRAGTKKRGIVAAGSTERRLAAIMVADIGGFSRLMERDESQTFARLRRLRDEVVTPNIAEHGGRIVKSTGDGFLAEFASVTAAWRSALDIQREIVAREAGNSADTRMRLRIGINVGDIIIDGDDVAGDGVNIAARLESIAPLDGICISAHVREQLRDDLGATLADLGEQRLKNIARPIHAFAATLAGAQGVPSRPGHATPPPADLPSIAVLPFANLSGGDEND
jgi:class 3 adenylate cyclase